MDEVTQAVENLKREWSRVVAQLEVCIAAIESCVKLGKGTEEASSLPRLNGSALDALQLLNALQCRLDLLAEQLPTFEEVQSVQATLGSWKEKYQRTKAGMTSAAESTTDSLRRSRQLMVQEVGRSANTLSTFDGLPSVLRKAEGEYQGHRSLLMRTRGLLSTMQRQDVLDRIILTTGFLVFSLAVLYVASRRIGLFTLQRKLADAIRSGSVSAGDILGKVQEGPAPTTNAPPNFHV
uniref:Sec20 C-terminal domain-containing protein n=1 Tax=Triticum aestivum TaxID=4565 RepID=A0A3B6BZI6_WHEAT